MILTIIITIILIHSIFRGWRLGFVQGILRLIGYGFVLILAKSWSGGLGQWLSNWFPSFATAQPATTNGVAVADGNQALYNGIAFLLLLLVGGWFVHFLIRHVRKVTKLPILHQIDSLCGMLINFGIVYVIVFLLLGIFQFWPSTWLANQFATSNLAHWIMINTPILSDQFFAWLVNR